MLWAVFQHWTLDPWMQRFILADDPQLIISIAMHSVFKFLWTREREAAVSTLGKRQMFAVAYLFPTKWGWIYQSNEVCFSIYNESRTTGSLYLRFLCVHLDVQLVYFARFPWGYSRALTPPILALDSVPRVRGVAETLWMSNGRVCAFLPSALALDFLSCLSYYKFYQKEMQIAKQSRE